MMKFSNNYDLIICGISYINEKYEKIQEFIPVNNNFKMICEYSFSWNKIFKKELFNNIEFPVGKIFEDFFTIPKVYLKAKNVKIISKSYYNYYQRSVSLSHKRDNIKMFDHIDSYCEIEKFLKVNDLRKELEEFLILKKQFKKIFYNYFVLQSLKFKINHCKTLKEGFEKLKLWNKCDVIKSIFFILYPKYQLRKIFHLMKGIIVE